MDAEGARELTRRIGPNASVAPRPLAANVSAGAMPVYRWFGGEGDDGAAAARVTEPLPSAKRPSLRRFRLPGR